MSRKPILCLDFDGVCHHYRNGWKGAETIDDTPVPGLFEFIAAAQKHFRIAIYSSRSGQFGGIAAMKEWFDDHNGILSKSQIDKILWPTEKPPAHVSIDDRALTFKGTWPKIEDLVGFKPWNKSPPEPDIDMRAVVSSIARLAGSASCSMSAANWHAALVDIIAKCNKAGFDILGEPKTGATDNGQ
jgi:hypothetical protein